MTRWVSRQKDGIWVWVFSAGLCFEREDIVVEKTKEEMMSL
jgi:hypothetical protein